MPYRAPYLRIYKLACLILHNSSKVLKHAQNLRQASLTNLQTFRNFLEKSSTTCN